MNKIKTLLSTAAFRISAVMAFATGLMLTLVAGGPVHADTLTPLPADPTGGALNTASNTARTWVTNIGIPAYVAVLIFAVIVGIAFRWIRKMRAAGKA